MKWKPGKKQLSIMLSVIICSLVVMLIYYVLFRGYKITNGIKSFLHILTPIIYGCVIGYILSPILNNIEKRILYPIYRLRGIDLSKQGYWKEKKKARKLGVLITMALFFLLLYGMIMILVPQLVKSIREIVFHFPLYVANLQKWTDTYLNDNPSVRRAIDNLIQSYSATLMEFVKQKFLPNVSSAITIISKSMVSAIKVFFYFVVGVVVAVYVLNSKETFMGQGKKICYAYFRKEVANELIGAFRYAHYTFTGFVNGKIVDSLIIGLICFVVTSFLKIPYPVLLSFAVGITNLIPFFGPYIGAAFGIILLIMINPIKALVFLIFIVILQNVDGNIIGPLILGNSTGLSSFWVIFAIMLFGGIWGPIGWIIGVPVFACIYTFFGYITKKKLREKKLPRDTSTYIDAAYIDDEEGIVNIEDADNTKYYVHNEASSWRRIFKFYKKSKKYLKNAAMQTQLPLDGKESDEIEPEEKKEE